MKTKTQKDESDVRMPPNSIEAEVELLGCMLYDNDCLDDALDKLGATDFYKLAHQKVYEAIRVVNSNGAPANLLTVYEELERTNEVEEIGGAYFLSGLTENIWTASKVPFLIKTIQEKSKIRNLIVVLDGLVKMAYGNEPEVIEKASEKLFDLVIDSESKTGWERITDLIVEVFELLERIQKNEHAVSVTSGLKDLDKLIMGGFRPAEMVVIAGRPASGKTALAVNIAFRCGVPVGVFSVETSALHIAMRTLMSFAEVPFSKAQQGKLSKSQWDTLTAAAAKLNQNIFIDDSADTSILKMRLRARKLKMKHDVKLLILDYLQLVPPSENMSKQARENENVLLTHISRTTKIIAKELNIPVIALSQLSRKVEDRADKRPVLSDLRGSGSIEQDADLVIMLYRDAMYNSEADDNVELLVLKQRNGPIGTVKAAFRKDLMLFSDIDKIHKESTQVSLPYADDDEEKVPF